MQVSSRLFIEGPIPAQRMSMKDRYGRERVIVVMSSTSFTVAQPNKLDKIANIRPISAFWLQNLPRKAESMKSSQLSAQLIDLHNFEHGRKGLEKRL